MQIEDRWILNELDKGLVAQQLVLIDRGLLKSPDPFEIGFGGGQDGQHLKPSAHADSRSRERSPDLRLTFHGW